MLGRHLLLPCAALLAVWAQPAIAGALRVMPVRVEVASGRNFCALTIGNDADRPVTVQVRGFGWTRDAAGADTLDPANAPVVNPAIATIPAGESRLVRCSLPGEPVGFAAEQQWRLIIDELPLPTAAVAPGTVQTLLRLSVPVFRTPPDAKPQLNGSLNSAPGGVTTFALVNSGQRRAQVLRLVMHLRNGRAVPVDAGFYLLAGGSMSLRLPAGIDAAGASFEAETDIGTLPVKAEPNSGPQPDHRLVLSRPAAR